MDILEIFKELKQAMHEKFDEAHEIYDKAMGDASEEFVENFRSLVINATQEEFIEFLLKDDCELDEADKLAALAFRLESAAKVEAEVEEKPEKRDNPEVVIISLS